ncbi:TolC family protein [Flavobacterium sp.]|uniref:TolC family protein n=1 Tax=Flavobacterium sp. TaxID=239 RepID=UPI00262A790D|nr:TolC family protein [Flavobacterium sp.]MDD3005555.1 TolC family protein [Flavobacterium sp.]
MNARFLKLITVSVFTVGSAFAQQPLQLQEAIEQMKQNNTQLKVQQHEIDFSNAELSGTLSGFLPKISVSHTGFYTNDPLNSFGFKLQQKIVTQADFNPVLLNNPDEMYHFNTKFLVQQPILNFDVFSARKALKEKIKATEYQKEFAEEMLTVEIKNAYTNLQFLYEAKKAVLKGISAYQEVLRNTKNMQEQGYAKPSDVLMVQVGLTEVQNKQIEIDNNISNLSDYLSWLMGKKSNEIYVPTEELTQKVLLDPNSIFSENRADILAMKSGLEAQNKMVSINKNGLLPRLNAFGEFNYNDKDIGGFGANGFMAGVSLSWDIFDGNTTLNKIRQSKITVEKAQTEMQLYIEKNQLELQKAKRDLTSNQAKITLTKTAKEQAGETLRILENRYAQGLEKTSDVLVSQTTDLEKQVNYLEAIKDYNLSAIQIEFLTQQSK